MSNTLKVVVTAVVALTAIGIGAGVIVPAYLNAEANAGTSTTTSNSFDGYTRITPVNIDNTGGDAKTNYQALVTFSGGSDIVSNAQADGSDIRVTLADDKTTIYDHWIESWNGTDGYKVWVEIPFIAAGGDVDVDFHYDAASGNYSDGAATFEFFEDWSSPIVGTSNEAYDANRLQPGNIARYGQILTTANDQGSGSGGWRETSLREPSRAIYDATDSTWPYKMYVAGENSGLPTDYAMGLAVSTDGISWQWYNKASTTLTTTEAVGQSIISVADSTGIEAGDWVVFEEGDGSNEEWRSVLSVDSGTQITLNGTTSIEHASGTTLKSDSPVIGSVGSYVEADDAYIYIEGSTYHMFCEDTGGGNVSGGQIDHYTSTDKGYTWTADPANPVLTLGTASAWDDDKVGSPIILKDGSTYVMVYDGSAGIGDQHLGVATATTLTGANWTKEATNPVIDDASPSWPFAGFVASDIVLADSTYYMFIHNGGGGDQGVYTTTDAPATWDNTSWSATANNSPFAQMDPYEYMLVENTNNTRFVFWNQAADTTLGALDLLADSDWTFSRHNIDGADSDPDEAEINAYNNVLQLHPSTSITTDSTLAAFTTGVDQTIDYRVITRLENATLGGAREQTRLFIGDGGTTANALNSNNGNGNWGGFTEGYALRFDDDAGGDRVGAWEVSAGTLTSLQTFTALNSNLTTASTLEIRYYDTGVGSFQVAQDGAAIFTVADTTHQALGKEILIGQGSRDPEDDGALLDVHFVAVGPYDGVDTTFTPGTAEAVVVTVTGTECATFCDAMALTWLMLGLIPVAVSAGIVFRGRLVSMVK